jgi:SAM-dependent methyltransferase
MTWQVAPVAAGTRIEIIAEDVPRGISAEDHAHGFASSLANLAGYLASSRSDDEQVSERSPEYWDASAATFDDEPDHGLADPAARRAWRELLLPLVGSRSRIADLGCGTGTLSVLLAEHGHQVIGVDFSPRMVEIARGKAADAGVDAQFALGDAAAPPLASGSYDVVLARHVRWAIPDPGAALDQWIGLLAPGGVLLLVEGRWHTGAGLTRLDCAALVRQRRSDVEATPLDDAAYWGGPVDDDRYLVVSRR